MFPLCVDEFYSFLNGYDDFLLFGVGDLSTYPEIEMIGSIQLCPVRQLVVILGGLALQQVTSCGYLLLSGERGFIPYGTT